MGRPSMFVGSSSEGKLIAQHVRSQLKDTVEVTIWHEGPFGLGQGTLESLVKASGVFDFAALVLTPDDLVESRTQTMQSPRDNVLFECGLFMGRLGRRRTFLIYDADTPLKIPSDLAGVSNAVYRGRRDDGNLLAAVGEACDPIRNAVLRLGSREQRTLSELEIGSARLVYLLRYLDAKEGFVRKSYIGQVLYTYPDPYAPIHAPFDEEGWKRAASYALNYLGAERLVETSGHEVRISDRGRRYLSLATTRTNHAPAFLPQLPA